MLFAEITPSKSVYEYEDSISIQCLTGFTPQSGAVMTRTCENGAFSPTLAASPIECSLGETQTFVFKNKLVKVNKSYFFI